MRHQGGESVRGRPVPSHQRAPCSNDRQGAEGGADQGPTATTRITWVAQGEGEGEGVEVWSWWVVGCVVWSVLQQALQWLALSALPHHVQTHLP